MQMLLSNSWHAGMDSLDSCPCSIFLRTPLLKWRTNQGPSWQVRCLMQAV